MAGACVASACAPVAAEREPTPTPVYRCGDPVDGDGFEYIVVGSGAGGGPIAARLARAGRRVLLLEAGSDVGDRLEYQVPALHAFATEHPDLAWHYYVDHHAEPGVDESDTKHTDEGILYPRGSALGGSTAVNALVTVLPSRSDWNRIAEITGEPAWRADAMDPYIDRVREWLPVEPPDPTLAIDDPNVTAYLMAAATTLSHESPLGTSVDPFDAVRTSSELGRLLSQDLNDALRRGETTGLYRFPLATTPSGRRWGTRELILNTVADGCPLTVETESFVTKVLFDRSGARPRAVGVEVARGAHLYRASLAPTPPPAERDTLTASREVIVSAGAFNTPQLLMLSGIGDAAQLDERHLDVVADLPGVGQNLQDRYEIAVVSELAEPFELIARCQIGAPNLSDDPCLADWRDGNGPYTTTGFLASTLQRSSGASLADLQIFATPGDVRGYYPGYAEGAVQTRNRFSWVVLEAHTHNRDGEVRLRTTDPFARPDIAFNYYDEADPLADPDLRAMVEAVRFIRATEDEMRRTEQSLVERWPGSDLESDADLAAWIRRESWGHHASCSAAMGADGDPRAVLDARLRVRGVDGLRVVDASIFPEIPGTFIAFPIFMASERAADLVLEDAEDHP
ncbi:MAG: GMC family oxidoreductase [Sandaracinaceae bacterium]